MKQLKGTKKKPGYSWRETNKQGTAEENHEFKKKIIIIPYSR